MKKLWMIALISAAGCDDKAKRNMQPEIAASDSAIVMYYHTPGNPRFFKMSKVYDTESMRILNNDINGKIIKPRDTCTTQGKIYFYGQKGAIYVAYFSRIDDCMTFSFIKTGEKYFTGMSRESRTLLDKLQKESKEPVPQNQ